MLLELSKYCYCEFLEFRTCLWSKVRILYWFCLGWNSCVKSCGSLPVPHWYMPQNWKSKCNATAKECETSFWGNANKPNRVKELIIAFLHLFKKHCLTLVDSYIESVCTKKNKNRCKNHSYWQAWVASSWMIVLRDLFNICIHEEDGLIANSA